MYGRQVVRYFLERIAGFTVAATKDTVALIDVQQSFVFSINDVISHFLPCNLKNDALSSR